MTAAFLGYLALVNILAWLAFASDKRRASLGLWRVPERTLILISLAGGAPAALAAQTMLRHKTRKEPFRSGLPVAAGLWIGLVLFMLYETAAQALGGR